MSDPTTTPPASRRHTYVGRPTMPPSGCSRTLKPRQKACSPRCRTAVWRLTREARNREVRATVWRLLADVAALKALLGPDER